MGYRYRKMGVIHIDETSFKQNHSRTRLWYIKLSILVHEYTLKFLFVPQIALNIVKKISERILKMISNGDRTIGMRTTGMRTIGMRTIGMRTIGMRTIGMRTIGMRTIGMRTTGLRTIGMRTTGMRTIGMRTIGMEGNWHAENWHGGQLALTF